MKPSIWPSCWLGGDQGDELDPGVFAMLARVCDSAVGVPREGFLVNGQHFLLGN
jgi:hypothetical protein